MYSWHAKSVLEWLPHWVIGFLHLSHVPSTSRFIYKPRWCSSLNFPGHDPQLLSVHIDLRNCQLAMDCDEMERFHEKSLRNMMQSFLCSWKEMQKLQIFTWKPTTHSWSYSIGNNSISKMLWIPKIGTDRISSDQFFTRIMKYSVNGHHTTFVSECSFITFREFSVIMVIAYVTCCIKTGGHSSRRM